MGFVRFQDRPSIQNMIFYQVEPPKMAFQEVATSQDLEEGKGIEIVWQGNIIALFRHSGVIYAIDGICMHQGGPLAKGKLSEGTIQCPWHGWKYDLKTGNNSATCQSMLKPYCVREKDGKIEIDFDA